jgi:hypothetical protein
MFQGGVSRNIPLEVMPWMQRFGRDCHSFLMVLRFSRDDRWRVQSDLTLNSERTGNGCMVAVQTVLHSYPSRIPSAENHLPNHLEHPFWIFTPVAPPTTPQHVCCPGLGLPGLITHLSNVTASSGITSE